MAKKQKKNRLETVSQGAIRTRSILPLSCTIECPAIWPGRTAHMNKNDCVSRWYICVDLLRLKKKSIWYIRDGMGLIYVYKVQIRFIRRSASWSLANRDFACVHRPLCASKPQPARPRTPYRFFLFPFIIRRICSIGRIYHSSDSTRECLACSPIVFPFLRSNAAGCGERKMTTSLQQSWKHCIQIDVTFLSLKVNYNML